MNRKILSVILSAVMLISLSPCVSYAKTYGGEFNSTTNDPNGNPYTLVWIVDETEKTLYIEGNGAIGEMTSGQHPWKDYYSIIENIVIEEGITNIGKRGFASHPNVKSVSIPTSVAGIDMRAFEYCRSLSEITIPGTVKRIQDQAFLGCSSLKKAVFEDGIESIGCYLFGDCHSLEDVYVNGYNTVISRMRSNSDDGVWFRGINDFSRLTAHCRRGSNADKYFTADIYTITNWANDTAGNEKEQSYAKKPNYMTNGGYTLNVEYIED